MAKVVITDMGGASTTMVDVGGFIAPFFPEHTVQEVKRRYDNIPNYQFRDEDLMLCTFAKTGTNWMYEILMMVLHRSAERVKSNKVMTMLEIVSPEDVDKRPSPRIINSHNPPRYLPVAGMKAKQIKTILCLRNPKDTAVSYYNHMCGIQYYNYDGTWNDWLQVYSQGKFEYGRYTDYLLEWERLIQEEGFPLHVIYYEDLKANGLAEINKLLKFLEVQLDDELKRAIIDMCAFQKMAEAKAGEAKYFMKKDLKFFRKGEVGDWKNWFTVAQNENFETMWNTEMKDSNLFQFKYTSNL